MRNKLAALAALAGFSFSIADAATIGTFNGKLGTGASSAITGDGHVINDNTSYVTEGFLSGVHVFITGALTNFGSFGRPESQAALASEAAALDSWLRAGGLFIITGEHNGFAATYNSWLNPYGINLTGVNSNYNNPVSFITDPSDPYLANGVSGSTMPISNRGWYDLAPASASILAKGADNNPFAIKLTVGDGAIIAVADTYFLNDDALTGGSNSGVTFLLNAIRLAGGTSGNGGAPVGETPVPAAFLLMASALGLYRFGKRKPATR